MKERKYELIANIAEKFVHLSSVEKSFIAGYMVGKQELLFEQLKVSEVSEDKENDSKEKVN